MKKYPRQKEICERFFIAGLAYSDYQKATTLKAGSELTLTWERSNKHDPDAIRIDYKGIKLGYVPAHSNEQETLHEYREAKIKLHASVVSYNKTNPSHRMICVRVTAARLIDADESSEYQF